MNNDYLYLLMWQKDLFENEVIEEILRERTNSYRLQNKKNDFWILIAPEILKNETFEKKIIETNFFQQKNKKEELLTTKPNSYVLIISLNKEFIDWIKLRIGYFEEFQNIEINRHLNFKYTSNGITGYLKNDFFSFKKTFQFDKYGYNNFFILNRLMNFYNWVLKR